MLRMVALGVYRNKYEKMLKTMSQKFWTSNSLGDRFERSCTYFSKVMNMFSHINTASAFVTMAVLLCLPIIHRVKELPFKIWSPFVDVHAHPYFEIVIFWQWVTNYWSVLFVILCYDYIYVMFTTSSICQFKMLQVVLQRIGSNSQSGNDVFKFLERERGKKIVGDEEEKCLELLKICIEHHDVINR